MNRYIHLDKRLVNGQTIVSAFQQLPKERALRPEISELNSYFKFKRTVDLIVTILLLPLFLALSLPIIIIIKLESKGPVLIRQKRVGWRGNSYDIYKFRSMTDGENEKLEQFYTSHKITKFGKFIRKHRLDEVPQFWNIIKGDMSLIGPRPDIYVYYRQCNDKIPGYSQRYSIKPGLTGWAQINYPHCITVKCAKERLVYDLHYINKMSFRLDIKIMLMTIYVMISGKGGK